MARGRGRGRLSSIELLPAEASDIVVWAAREMAARKRTLTDIYAEFKQRLIALQGELGLSFDIPAFSSFHRHSVGQAELARRMEETRSFTSNLVERLDGLANEDLTIMVIEMLKTAMFEVLRFRGERGVNPKELMEMSRAIQALVSTAKLSGAQRDVIQDKIDAAAEDAIEKAAVTAREAGVSAERIAQMRREFLGVRPKVNKPTPPTDGEPA